MKYALFDSPIGCCGIAWSEKGITGFQLPMKNRSETEARVRSFAGARSASAPAAWVKSAIGEIVRHLSGKKSDLGRIRMDFGDLPPFHRSVYAAARLIPPGEVRTYGELAEAAGSPGAFRAVGQAMARNPAALIVPCHRVVAAGKKPGGFSAYGALDTKARLLAIEGYKLTLEKEKETILNGRDPLQHLHKADKILSKLIRRVGEYALKPDGKQEPFHALLESIVYQQITGKAARTIVGRLKDCFPHKSFPTPHELLKLSDEELRAAGLSRNKAASLRDLARKSADGFLPSLKQIRKMGDDEIVECLTEIRGIGRWTVEMFLIFNLGRMDILPVNDYGVRKGFALTYGLKELPSPKELAAHGEKWKPYRTVASWYLWRSLDTQGGRAVVLPG